MSYSSLNDKKVISIIGLGHVGQTIAQTLIRESKHQFIINLIDVADVSGSVLDLQHAASVYKRHQVDYNNDYLFNHSDFIFHTAGPYFELGASRLSVKGKSIEMTYDIFEGFKPTKNPFIIVITNPVDVISYHTWKATGLAHNQVFGTGTYLDTVRLEFFLSKYFERDTNAIKAAVYGEHGDSQVPIYSKTTINNTLHTKAQKKELFDQAAIDTVNAAYTIRKTQGATKFGVSLCALRMMDAILDDERFIAPASVLLNKANQELLDVSPIYLSVPSLFNAKGAWQIDLNTLTSTELDLLRKSAKIIEQCTNKTSVLI